MVEQWSIDNHKHRENKEINDFKIFKFPKRGEFSVYLSSIPFLFAAYATLTKAKACLTPDRIVGIQINSSFLKKNVHLNKNDL